MPWFILISDSTSWNYLNECSISSFHFTSSDIYLFLLLPIHHQIVQEWLVFLRRQHFASWPFPLTRKAKTSRQIILAPFLKSFSAHTIRKGENWAVCPNQRTFSRLVTKINTEICLCLRDKGFENSNLSTLAASSCEFVFIARSTIDILVLGNERFRSCNEFNHSSSSVHT